jgi:hypothetical protein
MRLACVGGSMPETGENVIAEWRIGREDHDVARAHGLTPRARKVAMAAPGIAPRVMGSAARRWTTSTRSNSARRSRARQSPHPE